MTEYSHSKTREYRKIFPNFQNWECFKKDLKLTVFLKLHSRKIIRISEQIMSAVKYHGIFLRLNEGYCLFSIKIQPIAILFLQQCNSHGYVVHGYVASERPFACAWIDTFTCLMSVNQAWVLKEAGSIHQFIKHTLIHVKFAFVLGVPLCETTES